MIKFYISIFIIVSSLISLITLILPIMLGFKLIDIKSRDFWIHLFMLILFLPLLGPIWVLGFIISPKEWINFVKTEWKKTKLKQRLKSRLLNWILKDLSNFENNSIKCPNCNSKHIVYYSIETKLFNNNTIVKYKAKCTQCKSIANINELWYNK